MQATSAEIRTALKYLTEAERIELEELIAADMADVPWRALPGPQTMARESEADIIGFGGAAGGGKTDLVVGLVSTEHSRSLIVRREKNQTEGIVQRMTEVHGSTDGYSSQKSAWNLQGGRLCEFAGLDNVGDERRWQGRPHDLKAFDEVTEQREQQVRFVMGWTRSSNPSQRLRVLMTFNPPETQDGRWVIDFFGPWLDKMHPLYPTPPGVLRFAAMLPDGQGGSRDKWLDRGDPFVLGPNHELVYDFDPEEYSPEEIIKPKTRTFIPSRVTDNPYYMASDYISTLQSLPEPLRSQMLFGDFEAGMRDDAWQLFPTEWVDAAMARWKPRAPKGEMLNIGADVARGGKDKTVFAPRHADLQAGHQHWFDQLQEHAGKDTPNGPVIAGLIVAMRRDQSPVCIDVIGVGASPHDTLVGMKIQSIGVNVAELTTAVDKTGALHFSNTRSLLYWRFREALDPANDTGIAIHPDPEVRKELLVLRWKPQGRVVHVESRDEIIKRLGYSPDRATALVLANMEVPKIGVLQAAGAREAALAFDPYKNIGAGPQQGSSGYDPYLVL